jgi:hypothetical protein
MARPLDFPVLRVLLSSIQWSGIYAEADYLDIIFLHCGYFSIYSSDDVSLRDEEIPLSSGAADAGSDSNADGATAERTGD